MSAARWDSRWVPAALWVIAAGTTAMTIWFSLASAPPDVGSDKDLHAIAYFVNTLTIVVAAGWRPGAGRGPSYTWTAAIVVGMLALGALLEVIQGTTFDRSADRRDWIADAIGVAAATLVFIVIRLLRRPDDRTSGPTERAASARRS